MEVSVKILEANSPLIQRVIELGDANSATLGFLPHVAFENHAVQGNILIAITPQNQCIGYLLFRIVKRRQTVSITHLCVDENFRSNGIAGKLVNRFKQLTKDWRGISLSSRRDYRTNTFWEHAGFVAVGEKLGRGKDRMTLTLYWYDHQHPNLFSYANSQQIEAKSTQAVIDANLVYELYQNPNHPLLADWLLEDVILCVSPEMFNEINRSKNKAGRKKMRNYVRSNFPETTYARSKFEISHELVKSNYSRDQSRPQNISDLKQIAYAIAANAEFFVTNDNNLKKELSEYVSLEFGLRIVRPDDLIIQLDELMNSAKYQQHRLAGSLINISQVTTGQSDLLAQTFQVQGSEKKSHLASILRGFLAEPQQFEANVITTRDNELLALIVYSKEDSETLEIPVIRVLDNMNLSALASHLLFRTVRNSVSNGQQFVRVSDKHLSADVLQGLIDNSFSNQGVFWEKTNIQGVFTLPELKTKLDNTTKSTSEVTDLFNQLFFDQDKNKTENLINLERLLWPMKIDHNDIPSYLLPIRADWAVDLFDSNLGRQTLLGSNPDLVFKMDNVYYRSARQKLPTAPSRILWYVSRGGKKQTYQGDMSIRACSYVDEVVISTPKDLFKQFSKLGVYSWQNVYETAGKNVDKKILAFRFSRTELFENPVSLKKLEQILNRKGAPQGPMKLGVEQFNKLYRIGIGEVKSYDK